MENRYLYSSDGKRYIVEIIEDLGDEVIIAGLANLSGKGRRLSRKKVNKSSLTALNPSFYP